MSQSLSPNPWLGGKLVRRKGVMKLQYPHTSSGTDTHFYVVDNVNMKAHEDINSSMQYLTPALSPFVVKKTKYSIDKDEPQFAVVIGALNTDQFFLFMSISHILADGHTFYQVYRMISQDVKA